MRWTFVNVLVKVIDSKGSEAGWHVFNDFLVQPIPEEEALSFPGIWKVSNRVSICGNEKLYLAYAEPASRLLSDPGSIILPESRPQ